MTETGSPTEKPGRASRGEREALSPFFDVGQVK
jgi:hypothetical protein